MPIPEARKTGFGYRYCHVHTKANVHTKTKEIEMTVKPKLTNEGNGTYTFSIGPKQYIVERFSARAFGGYSSKVCWDLYLVNPDKKESDEGCVWLGEFLTRTEAVAHVHAQALNG